MSQNNGFTEEKRYEFSEKLRLFLRSKPIYNKLLEASINKKPLILDQKVLASKYPELSEVLTNNSKIFFGMFTNVLDDIEIPSKITNIKFTGLENSGIFIDNVFDSRNYFDDNNLFVPKLLADDIKNNYIFKTATDNEEIYVYDSGIYKSGERLIKEECGKRLGEYSRIRRVSETIHHVRITTYTERDSVPVKFISLKNGLFDIEEMELKEHTPDFFLISQLPFNYNREADCPQIKKFLSQIVSKEDMEIIHEMIGYCLYRAYPIHKAFMFLGQGSNGKSTTLELIKMFLGFENVSNVSLQELDQDRFAAASLYGKLANIYADVPDQSLYNTGKFKMLVGADTIGAQFKFKERFSFKNHAKLLFSANKLPETRDDTDAFFRRWMFINFPNRFESEKKDPYILKKLTTPEELSGLFNWAIEGLQNLLKRGDFPYSISTDQAREFYERASSPTKAFLLDCVTKGSEEFVVKDDLYTAFIEYCKKNKFPTLPNNTFARKVKEIIPITEEKKTVLGKRKNCWTGIALNTTVYNKNQDGVKDVKDVRVFCNFKSSGKKKVGSIKVKKNVDNLDNPDTSKKINLAFKLSLMGGECHIDYLKNYCGFTVKEIKKLESEGKIQEIKPAYYRKV